MCSKKMKGGVELSMMKILHRCSHSSARPLLVCSAGLSHDQSSALSPIVSLVPGAGPGTSSEFNKGA